MEDRSSRTFPGKEASVPAPPLIAIIEDDDSLRPALIGLVRSLGYEAEGFASAEAFLDAGAQHRAACLVTDLQLPGLGGLELKTMLAASGCVLPAIVITARGEAALEKRALACGALCLLRKPFEADALIAAIERALDS
jgi:FixJ family two-component response regulator